MIGKEISKPPAALYVGVGVRHYTNKSFTCLPNAIEEAEKLKKLLESRQYKGHVIRDPSKTNALDELDEYLPKDRLRDGGCLVVLWSGHGEPRPHGHLGLVLTNSQPGETHRVTTEYLAELVAHTGANQILIILDTCYSGGAIVSASAVIDRVLSERPPAKSQTWVGVVSSTLDYQQARDGIFWGKLFKLLTQGPDPNPADESLIYRWSVRKDGVTADDLIYTLINEWDVDLQTPKRGVFGEDNCELRFPNPLYRPDAPDRVVEHLLLAARGVDPGVEGFFFTGRVAQINRIVAWMLAGKPGVFLVVGPAGSGKSAIVGRILSLSNSKERAIILSKSHVEHADPGESSVHAHVHVLGLSPDQICQAIDEQLVGRGVIPSNPSGSRNRWELLGMIERIQEQLVLVIDGLDESGAWANQIAEDLIRLLAEKCLILVSTRNIPSLEGKPSPIQTLAPLETIDLGEAAIEAETRSDVRLYVEKRLGSISEKMDPSKIAKAVIQIAREQQEGLFLLARVITTQLRTTPVDTSLSDWKSGLDRSIEAAFDREISAIIPLRRDEQELPNAARELLAALAWSYGFGAPDDIWPIVATALSPTHTVYQRDDIFWLLSQAGRYVVEGGDGGRAVYRLVHPRLVEHLHSKPVTMAERSIEEKHAARIASALIERYLQLLEQGQSPEEHPYLWKHMWRHCADAGEKGIAGLRELVHLDAILLHDLAMALDNLGTRYSEVDKQMEAVEPAKEAVEIYRELAATYPAFLPGLAGSLNNLGKCYREVGAHAVAVASVEEAVDICNRLAATNSAVLPDLAGSLTNLGISYSEVGKRREAVAPTEEAVKIRRKLAETNPAFLPDLARSLNNLGVRYSEVGKRREAVAPTEEAVKIRRKLAETNPAFLPDLACALNNLSVRYREVGKFREAMAPTQRAVKIRRKLAETNPLFLPSLASALNNLCIGYWEVGYRREAVASAEEAVKIHRKLAETNPSSLPDLAKLLSNLGIYYSGVGNSRKAVAAAEEAVERYRKLAETNPAYLPGLVMALNNLGIYYRKVGKRYEAVAPTEKAVEGYRKLVVTNLALLPNLAMALNNLGQRYSEVGKSREALARTELAVKMYRKLVKTEPVFFRDLAGALNNLGQRNKEVGKRREAATSTEEAVEIFSDLAKTNEAFLSSLSIALKNLDELKK